MAQTFVCDIQPDQKLDAMEDIAFLASLLEFLKRCSQTEVYAT